MLDQETLKPVIISMIVYLVVAKMIPDIIKKPTGITFIDEVTCFSLPRRVLSSGALLRYHRDVTGWIESEFS